MFFYTILIFLLVFITTSLTSYFLIGIKSRFEFKKAKIEVDKIIEKAKTEGNEYKTRVKEQVEKFNNLFIKYEKHFTNQQDKTEKSIKLLEEKLVKKEEENKKIETEVNNLNKELEVFYTNIEKEKEKKIPLLSKVSSFQIDKAKDQIIQNLQDDLNLAKELRITKYINSITEDSPTIAKNMLIEAIHRFSAPTSVEKKSLIIPINRNETKAKLMGNNLEVLTFLEDHLGVDIVFDDSKPGITVSHYELVKKHIARETILKLIKDKNISIELAQKRLDEATKETKAMLIDIGKKIVNKLELQYRNFPDDFKEILGRLKYRTSYGQNILKHCFEVGFFTLLLGNELGLNEEICKIGGFFHDLGKAIDQEDGRPHDILTKEIMERFNIFSWEEIHAAWTHHDAIPIETAEALLVKAGDAISAGRPGARQETIEKYLARIMAIEGIANSYEGVNKTYAISGGRELRVLVDPKRLDDQNLPELAEEIAKEIEDNVAYPGQIRVNVIRRIQHNHTIKEKNKKKVA